MPKTSCPMSTMSAAVPQALFDYLREHTRRDDDLMRALKREAADEGLPAIWIAEEQASLMQILLKLHRAVEVVEVGTLAGYSAIQMARALPAHGRVRTIEVEAKHAAFARRFVERAGLTGRVEVHLGAGIDVLRTFDSRSADAAFLDADKQSYAAYLDECLRILRPGGLLMVDNAFAFGHLLDDRSDDSEVHAIRAFNDRVAREDRVHGVIVPVGDGLWVATVGEECAGT